MQSQMVSLWYRCPELLQGETFYGPGVDMWSIGCIIAEMCLKSALFQGNADIDQLFLIFEVIIITKIH